MAFSRIDDAKLPAVRQEIYGAVGKSARGIVTTHYEEFSDSSERKMSLLNGERGTN